MTNPALALFPTSTKLELLHPITKEPFGFVLEILPYNHDAVYQANINVVKKLGDRAKTAVDVLMSLDRQIDVATACIAGWTNTNPDIVDAFKQLGFTKTLEDGTVVGDDSFSAEKAHALISMPTAGFIRDQIERCIADKERFFKSASLG